MLGLNSPKTNKTLDSSTRLFCRVSCEFTYVCDIQPCSQSCSPVIPRVSSRVIIHLCCRCASHYNGKRTRLDCCVILSIIVEITEGRVHARTHSTICKPKMKNMYDTAPVGMVTVTGYEYRVPAHVQQIAPAKSAVLLQALEPWGKANGVAHAPFVPSIPLIEQHSR